MHFRQPLSERKKREIEAPDAVFKFNLLDPVKEDLPKRIWSLKTDVSQEIVTLRSLLWPGFLSYHFLDTDKFGFAYFGDGIKNVDISLYV